ncbi:MAG TPA: hypothetical protein VEV38_05875 [Candidatus Eremiobacteraceae bacterium]|nr:hypothetical protein [Candidatus Eremiobacteraceae bacterium]
MRPLDEQSARSKLKRRLNFILGWATLPIYIVVIGFVMMTWSTWPGVVVTAGFVILVAYSIFVLYVVGGVTLYRSHGEIEPTEWMRRGGLMAAPEPSAHPDEERIRDALEKLPADFPIRSRDEVAAYLAMPDDDAKQLRRDNLIREFYECAGSADLDLPHRRAYNDLRHAISPWTEPDDAD